MEAAAPDGCSLDANVHETVMLEGTADAMGTVLDFCALDIAMESATWGRCQRGRPAEGEGSESRSLGEGRARAGRSSSSSGRCRRRRSGRRACGRRPGSSGRGRGSRPPLLGQLLGDAAAVGVLAGGLLVEGGEGGVTVATTTSTTRRYRPLLLLPLVTAVARPVIVPTHCNII